MQVAAHGVAGVADLAEVLAGVDGVADLHRGALAQVHVRVVDVRALAVDHDVVARRGMEAAELHLAAAGGDQRRAAGGEHVLALMGVPGAAGAEVRAGAAEIVAAADREHVPVKRDRLVVRRRRGRSAAPPSTHRAR